VNVRPPQLSPLRLLAGLVLPWIAYLIVRSLIGSSIAALAMVVTTRYLRNQKKRLDRGSRWPRPGRT
jgi:hypothetical protein